jgi:enoyl-[acyl-carrier protein] reductase/trans-2-enoyl-CoA reductase (NAD+)
MLPEVQSAVNALMKEVTENNVAETTDIAGFKHDFLEANGFDVADVNYEADVDTAGIDL